MLDQSRKFKCTNRFFKKKHIMPPHKVETVKHLAYFSLYIFIIFIEMETEMEKEMGIHSISVSFPVLFIQ